MPPSLPRLPSHLLDWREHGQAYAAAMIELSRALAAALDAEGLPVFGKANGFTQSHQFAVEAARFGGGQAASKTLRKAGFLACGIGLPIDPVNGDMNGLRIGTPELVRWGVTVNDIPALAGLLAEALTSDTPEALAPKTAALRKTFNKVHYVNG
jgi:glycine hydroxymethyltransferase